MIETRVMKKYMNGFKENFPLSFQIGIECCLIRNENLLCVI